MRSSVGPKPADIAVVVLGAGQSVDVGNEPDIEIPVVASRLRTLKVRGLADFAKHAALLFVHRSRLREGAVIGRAAPGFGIPAAAQGADGNGEGEDTCYAKRGEHDLVSIRVMGKYKRVSAYSSGAPPARAT